MTPRKALKLLADKFHLFEGGKLNEEQMEVKRALTALSISVNESERERRLRKYT